MNKDMKQLIADVFLKLVYEKGMDNVTISYLVEECHISRQSFYYHFKDMYAVVGYIIHRTLLAVRNECFHVRNQRAAVHIFSMRIAQKEESIRALLNTKHRFEVEEIMLEEFRKFLDRVFHSPYYINNFYTAKESGVYVEFWACGITKYVVARCIDSTLDVAEMTQFLSDAMERMSDNKGRGLEDEKDVRGKVIYAADGV